MKRRLVYSVARNAVITVAFQVARNIAPCNKSEGKAHSLDKDFCVILT